MSRLTVVGLAGVAGSGKNYIAERYFAPLGFRPVALADHFKIGAVGKGKATLDEVMITKPPAIRTYLQEEGTEYGRDLYGSRVWVKTLYAWMEHWARTWDQTRYVITDIRFPDEIDHIHEADGFVYQVIAPERAARKAAEFTPEQRAHSSEHALRSHSVIFDGDLYNDPKNEGIVGAQVRALLTAHGLYNPPQWAATR